MNDKKFPVHIEMDVTITQQDIDNFMCTALEGGINYWCREAKVVGEFLGECGSEQISRGGSLLLRDAESGERWELTLEKFLKGIELYIKESGQVMIEDFNLMDFGELDAGDTDCIVQYALFGKLVYG
jgi:hypothetical protein